MEFGSWKTIPFPLLAVRDTQLSGILYVVPRGVVTNIEPAIALYWIWLDQPAFHCCSHNLPNWLSSDGMFGILAIADGKSQRSTSPWQMALPGLRACLTW